MINWIKKNKICFFIIATLFLIIGYYTYEVVTARLKTPEIVDRYYASDIIKITKDDLSPRQVDIFLAIEDPNFYNHRGIDFKTPGAGWTTITQGLCKKFYFNDFQQGIMKIKQTLCARYALDPLVSKDEQLTLYLNIMYFGNDIYGLYDASNYYYDKSVMDLSEDEYISLIACLINPKYLNAKDNPKENAQRVARIKKVLSGEYLPNGLFDITYDGADN